VRGYNFISHAAKNCDEIRGSQPYAFHKATTANPKPLNYYLLNEDVVKVMRLIYDGTAKEILMEDDGILSDSEKGRLFLTGMTDEAWDNLVDVETKDQE
jgi:hypothetical protein